MHRARPRAASPARLVVVSLVLVAGLSACGSGGDPSEADIRDDMSEQLVEQGYTADQADCIAEVIVDEIGAKEIEDVDFSLEEPPADLADEIVAASRKALDDCQPSGEG